MILVDGIQQHDAPGLRYKRWSHMVSTTDEAELHAFAARLMLKRSWFQSRDRGNASCAHYDITPPKRALAVRLGAREATARVLARLNYDGLTRRGTRGEAERAAADAEVARMEHDAQAALALEVSL
jgi:hypothetical protein